MLGPSGALPGRVPLSGPALQSDCWRSLAGSACDNTEQDQRPSQATGIAADLSSCGEPDLHRKSCEPHWPLPLPLPPPKACGHVPKLLWLSPEDRALVEGDCDSEDDDVSDSSSLAGGVCAEGGAGFSDSQRDSGRVTDGGGKDGAGCGGGCSDGSVPEAPPPSGADPAQSSMSLGTEPPADALRVSPPPAVVGSVVSTVRGTDCQRQHATRCHRGAGHAELAQASEETGCPGTGSSIAVGCSGSGNGSRCSACGASEGRPDRDRTGHCVGTGRTDGGGVGALSQAEASIYDGAATLGCQGDGGALFRCRSPSTDRPDPAPGEHAPPPKRRCLGSDAAPNSPASHAAVGHLSADVSDCAWCSPRRKTPATPPPPPGGVMQPPSHAAAAPPRYPPRPAGPPCAGLPVSTRAMGHEQRPVGTDPRVGRLVRAEDAQLHLQGSALGLGAGPGAPARPRRWSGSTDALVTSPIVAKSPYAYGEAVTQQLQPSLSSPDWVAMRQGYVTCAVLSPPGHRPEVQRSPSGCGGASIAHGGGPGADPAASVPYRPAPAAGCLCPACGVRASGDAGRGGTPGFANEGGKVGGGGGGSGAAAAAGSTSVLCGFPPVGGSTVPHQPCGSTVLAAVSPTGAPRSGPSSPPGPETPCLAPRGAVLAWSSGLVESPSRRLCHCELCVAGVTPQHATAAPPVPSQHQPVPYTSYMTHGCRVGGSSPRGAQDVEGTEDLEGAAAKAADAGLQHQQQPDQHDQVRQLAAHHTAAPPHGQAVAAMAAGRREEAPSQMLRPEGPADCPPSAHACAPVNPQQYPVPKGPHSASPPRCTHGPQHPQLLRQPSGIRRTPSLPTPPAPAPECGTGTPGAWGPGEAWRPGSCTWQSSPSPSSADRRSGGERGSSGGSNTAASAASPSQSGSPSRGGWSREATDPLPGPTPVEAGQAQQPQQRPQQQQQQPVRVPSLGSSSGGAAAAMADAGAPHRPAGPATKVGSASPPSPVQPADVQLLARVAAAAVRMRRGNPAALQALTTPPSPQPRQPAAPPRQCDGSLGPPSGAQSRGSLDGVAMGPPQAQVMRLQSAGASPCRSPPPPLHPPRVPSSSPDDAHRVLLSPPPPPPPPLPPPGSPQLQASWSTSASSQGLVGAPGGSRGAGADAAATGAANVGAADSSGGNAGGGGSSSSGGRGPETAAPPPPLQQRERQPPSRDAGALHHPVFPPARQHSLGNLPAWPSGSPLPDRLPPGSGAISAPSRPGAYLATTRQSALVGFEGGRGVAVAACATVAVGAPRPPVVGCAPVRLPGRGPGQVQPAALAACPCPQCRVRAACGAPSRVWRTAAVQSTSPAQARFNAGSSVPPPQQQQQPE